MLTAYAILGLGTAEQSGDGQYLQQDIDANRQFTIYLPQSYEVDATRKYPILYLLHGMSGVNTSWFTDQRVKDVMDQLVASGEACEMIIVSPYAGGNPATCWNGYLAMPGYGLKRRFLL